MKTCQRCGFEKPETAFEWIYTSKEPIRRGTCTRCRKGQPHKAWQPANGAQRRVEGTRTEPKVAQQPPKLFVRNIPDRRRYIITAAQNATPVHAAFFETLQIAAAHLDAELVIVPLRYKNPTSRGADTSDDWWSDTLVPYLFDGRKRLHKHLMLLADVKSQPTAMRPLSGFEAMTGADSCIIGHPKMEFVTVAVPSGMPKIMTTTGAVTERNYSDTRAGKLGEFHHFLGAVIVELDDAGYFHLRQLNASREDGSFTDLDLHFTSEGVEPAPPALALALGDTHERVKDPDVDRATFGLGGMVETLNPDVLIFHDIADGETTNPHDVGNPFIAEAKRRAKRQEVIGELADVVAFVNTRSEGRKAVIVDSNHHDFLARWLIRTDWRSDLKNAAFYLKTALATLESAKMGPGGPEYLDPFPAALKELGLADNVQCLGPNESYSILGVEYGLHGHRGPNGARGSLKNLSRLGTKTVSGHTHSPGIEEGAYGLGTSSYLRLHYAKGPSSWLQTHCVEYATGKRSLISVICGRWRLEPIKNKSGKEAA